MKPFKFPDPKDYGVNDAIIFCPTDRMINLYNQAHGTNRTALAKGVKDWFREQAVENGWVACIPLKTVQTKHGAGCVLCNPTQVKQINIHQISITIQSDQ